MELEKKYYIEPECYIIKFESDDIMNTSTDETDPGLPDPFD